MARTVASFDELSQTAWALSARIWLLILPAAVSGAAAILVLDRGASIAFTVVALTLAAFALLLWSLAGCAALGRRRLGRRVLDIVANDPVPCIATDLDGALLCRNKAAKNRFGATPSAAVSEVFGALLADPGVLVRRLLGQAAEEGATAEDIVTPRGPLRLAVHRLGAGALLWRCDEGAGACRPDGEASQETATLTLDRGGRMLALNAAAHTLLGHAPSHVGEVFAGGEVQSGREQAIFTRTGAKRAFAVELLAGHDKREVFLLPEGGAPAELDGALFEALPVALLQLSTTGRVSLANRQARALLGDPHCTERALSDLVDGLGRPVRDWVEDAVSGHAAGRPEVLRAVRTEQETFLQVTLARLSEDPEACLVAVLNDATELKTLEAQFVQSQKMQAIGQLAGGVAHDFNNLLTAISGHCDLLLLRHDEGDPDFSDLDQISQNTNRAASLVGQLLAFSRKQNLRPEPLDLRETLADLTHLLNRLVGEKVTLSVDNEARLETIRADKRQLEQVMMNLVVNARDAMAEGGDIRITTEERHLDTEMRRDRAVIPAGDYVVVSVVDTGGGIPPDKLPKIFEPFFTTKHASEGTGLGLSTVYGIVKQSGGFVFADSELGRGTRFSLYFPVHTTPEPEDVERAPAPETAPSVRSRSGVVLLAEDEPPVRAFAARALRWRGHTVIETDSAETALETLEDTTLHVDVFVTDVIMPGMDGPTWVREALRARPETRVIFISGYAEESVAEAQADIAQAVFLPKPFSLEDLTATVARQLS